MEESSPIITKKDYRDIVYNNSNTNQKCNHQGAAVATASQVCPAATNGSSTHLYNSTSEDNGKSFGIKCNLSSLEVAKLSSHKYYYYNDGKQPNRRRSNSNNNKRISQPQLLKQQKKSKKKAFYIASDIDNDDTDDDDVVDHCYFDNNYSSTATAIASGSYENYLLLAEVDFSYNSCCSNSDDDYFDSLPTPTNTGITTNITNTSSFTSFTSSITTPSLSYIETTTYEDKQELSLMTRFVPASIGSNINNNQTVLSTSTVNHQSLYPSQLLRRCNTRCYTGLDEWFAARLHG